MKSHLLFLDFETYYDGDYTLKRMTPAEYILDRRYETIMVAVKADDEEHKIIDGQDFPQWLAQFDPKITTTVTFNSLFDNAILAWRYNFVPKVMIDAMGMARALDGHKLVKFSLKAISEHLGLEAKGDEIERMVGVNRAELISDPQRWLAFAAYAIQDNKNCEAIFKHYYPRFPRGERRLMNLVLRCCVEPKFIINQTLLQKHLIDVRTHKERLLLDAGRVDPRLLMSTNAFKKALEDLGVEVETKITPAGKEAPAFAKTDEFMERLQNHSDPAVAALAAARIGLRSTLEETRSSTLLRISTLHWKANSGTMPIPLRYGGAHTHRLSGDWKMNMQNLPRGSQLRYALEAPPGYKVITCDLGQIEARLVAWICEEKKLLGEFQDKKDPYNLLAGDIFGRPVDRKKGGPVDAVMGFIGKTGILGLGYGCGNTKFNSMVISSARVSGIDIAGIYNEAVGSKAWHTYRRRYPRIPHTWYLLDDIAGNCWCGHLIREFEFGPVVITHGEIILPNDLSLNYADPKPPMGDYTSHTYRYGKTRHTMYGAKMLENITQALARVIVMNAALRLNDRGYRFVHQAHDELVFIVPDDDLDQAKQIIHQEMTRPPSWGKDIPLVADVGVGQSYGDAK